MKKLLTLCLTLSISLSYSQIELRVHGETKLMNDSTITVTAWKGVDNSTDIAVEIDAKSIYSSTKTIKVKKIELSSTAPTSENAICWGLCTIGIVWNTSPIVVSDPIPVNASATTLFSGHVYPKLAHGVTKFRYVWFDANNTNDSAFVDVIFNVTEFVSVNKIEKEEVSLNIFPNPATSLLNVNLKSNTNSDKKLVIKNIVGKTIYSNAINNSIQNTKINTTEFNAGIYFVSVISNNKTIKTEKVVITK